MKTSTGITTSTLVSLLALILFAVACYGFVIWSNCDSSASTFLSDVRAFHGAGC